MMGPILFKKVRFLKLGDLLSRCDFVGSEPPDWALHRGDRLQRGPFDDEYY